MPLGRVITLVLPDEVARKVTALCEEFQVSRNDILLAAVKQYISRVETKFDRDFKKP